ncbi:uncharacterized protein N7483_003599 [Penicillium malachiteum]|uniref:uncharacterized protein n=1 Tax=Penicillium malachiteum TaxID=1324776 RepID=UPI0025477A4F|nr:uncharacterized protein N7483_003599 [Penicillium malachiteum]KAJ5729091.1 hypothetical protein N7483_003599 [Penicillium malachiteum]
MNHSGAIELVAGKVTDNPEYYSLFLLSGSSLDSNEMKEEALEASHQPRRLRLLYEPLYLLHSLGEVRRDWIKPGEVSHEDLGSTGPRCYQNFVDAIAYICAYRKEPEYVTAAALEDTPDAIVVFLAANGGIDRDVVIFLKNVVLVILSWVIKNHSISLVKTEGQKVMKVLADHVLSLNAPESFNTISK